MWHPPNVPSAVLTHNLLAYDTSQHLATTTTQFATQLHPQTPMPSHRHDAAKAPHSLWDTSHRRNPSAAEPDDTHCWHHLMPDSLRTKTAAVAAAVAADARRAAEPAPLLAPEILRRAAQCWPAASAPQQRARRRRGARPSRYVWGDRAPRRSAAAVRVPTILRPLHPRAQPPRREHEESGGLRAYDELRRPQKAVEAAIGRAQDVLSLTSRPLNFPAMTVAPPPHEGERHLVVPPEGIGVGELFAANVAGFRLILRAPAGWVSGEPLVVVAPALDDGGALPCAAELAASGTDGDDERTSVVVPESAGPSHPIVAVHTDQPPCVAVAVPSGARPGSTSPRSPSAAGVGWPPLRECDATEPLPARRTLYEGQLYYAANLPMGAAAGERILLRLSDGDELVESRMPEAVPAGHTLLFVPTWAADSRGAAQGHLADEDYDVDEVEMVVDIPAGAGLGETVLVSAPSGELFRMQVPGALGPCRRVALRLPRGAAPGACRAMAGP